MAVEVTHGTDGHANRLDGHPRQAVGVEDVVGVRSRVSWQAILGGAAVALALSFLLTLLGGAVGLSARDTADGRGIGTGAAVYAIVVTALCLFVGGLVASQLTSGENKREGALYGLFVWAVVFAALLFLVAGGVKAGYGAMVGAATVANAADAAAARHASQGDVEDALRRAGYDQKQMDDFRERVKNAPADARATADDAAARQRAAEAATRVTWWTFAGALLSMLAAAAGGYVGSGPTFRLFAVPVGRAAGSARR